MGTRDRKPRIKARVDVDAVDAALRAQAKAVVAHWNTDIRGRASPLWSPSIRCACLAGHPWLEIHCPGCATSRSIDLRNLDRHPEASVAGLVIGLRCTWCRGDAPMPRLLGLSELPFVAARKVAP